MERPVLERREGAVSILTFNRPEQLNAATREMAELYEHLLAAAGADPEVRAVVVTGAGRAFCAGADLGSLEGSGDADPSVHGSEGSRLPEGSDPDAMMASRIPKPVVAAINGHAIGYGFVLALAADIRIVSASARLSLPFARLGLAAEHATSWLLPRLVGGSRAADLLLTGRPISGAEAAEMGLVQRALEAQDVLPEALRLAEDLAHRCSPTSLAVIKAQLREDASGSLDHAYSTSEALRRESLDGVDLAEAISSMQEDRDPTFGPVSPGWGSGAAGSVSSAWLERGGPAERSSEGPPT